MSKYHQAVLLDEVINLLYPKPNENFIDCTLGGGGHAKAILEQNGQGKLLGIDLDSDAIAESKEYLKDYKDRIVLVQDNFSDLAEIVKINNFFNVSGILLDLGVSSYQLAEAEKGFSYRSQGPLDMRMGAKISLNASELLSDIDEKDLADILKKYGEVKRSHSLAKRIINFRRNNDFTNTADLKQSILGDKAIDGKNIKIISQVFQAIRIAVNHELENLEEVLAQALAVLVPGGRLVVISYHSLEDRIVKRFFRRESRDCICPDDSIQCQCKHKKSLKIITKKPITPTEIEIKQNKKSRSAKLRAIIKI